jgi:hypothetical protein
MRLYLLSDELANWVEKWAAKEGDGGFQDKCKEIQECEVLHFRGLTKAIRVEALNKAIECLQAYCAAPREAERERQAHGVVAVLGRMEDITGRTRVHS